MYIGDVFKAHISRSKYSRIMTVSYSWSIIIAILLIIIYFHFIIIVIYQSKIDQTKSYSGALRKKTWENLLLK